jgi:hypothetical protein
VEYSVGQVLYALSKKEMRVTPIRITERIVRQTLSGEIVSYVAQFPSGKAIADLSAVKGEIYIALNDVHEVMISNVTSVIDKIIDDASNRASSSFETCKENTLTNVTDIDAKNSVSKATIPSQGDQVVLADGIVANIKLSEGMR